MVTNNIVRPEGRGARNRLHRLRLWLRPRLEALNAREGLSAGWLWIAFLVTLLCIFARDPSLFTHPQFWAEDGKVWYAQAYNLGWLHSLTIAHAGYLNMVQRIGGGLAILVPFGRAPLIMASWGLLMQALPVPILLSPRCRSWAPLPMRILFAAIYIAIPNAREVHVVCTNAQWHLGIAALFLAFSEQPRTLVGRIFDIAIWALASLSGPFCVLLLPFLCAFWWLRRQPWSLVVLAVAASGSVIQLIVMHHNQAQRFSGYLGASPALFVRILGGDVFLGALFGSVPWGSRLPAHTCFVVTVLGLCVCAYCFRSTSLEIRLFFLYCLTLFVAGLHSPAVAPTNTPLWFVLLPQHSSRYFFYPTLPLLFSLVWCAGYARARLFRIAGVALTILLCASVWKDWRYPPLPDMHFPREVAAFESAPAGTNMAIPINPIG